MAYTRELINEVKELYLDDSCSTGMSIDKILLAVSLDELQTEARKMKRKVLLYQKWCEQDPRRQ